MSPCSKFPHVSALQPRIFRGDKLRGLRKASRLSQTQLGSRIGAHVTSISDWERGANAPSGRHVAALSREFGVDAEHFYGGDEEDEESRTMTLDDFLRVRVRELLHEAQAVRP